MPDDTNPATPKTQVSKRKFNALVQRVLELETDYAKFKEDEWQLLKDEYEEKIDKYDQDLKKLYKKVSKTRLIINSNLISHFLFPDNLRSAAIPQELPG